MSAPQHPQQAGAGSTNTFWRTSLRDTARDSDRLAPEKYGKHLAAYIMSISTKFSYPGGRDRYGNKALLSTGELQPLLPCKR